MVAPSVDKLPLVSGHPALDLVNTVEPRLPVTGRHEHLAGPDDLLAWAQRATLIGEKEAAAVEAAWAADPPAGASALTAVHQIREALAAALDAILDSAPDRSGLALDYLSLRWGAAAVRSRLVPDQRGVRLAVGSAPAELIPDRAVAAAVSLLCDADLAYLGICPPGEHGCGWLFLDRSKNRSRRWCTMNDCGAHAKAQRLTERRRAARASAVSHNGGS
jgi:predicted RNA-binding Zn ribbon-like protein